MTPLNLHSTYRPRYVQFQEADIMASSLAQGVLAGAGLGLVVGIKLFPGVVTHIAERISPNHGGETNLVEVILTKLPAFLIGLSPFVLSGAVIGGAIGAKCGEWLLE